MTDSRPPVLEELDGLPIGPAPIGAMLAVGRAAKRRRRTVLASVAGAAVLLTGGGLAATQVLGNDVARDSFVADGENPSPPAGTRWVGSGQVVVAVPDWWTTGETQCNAPVETTVYFDIAATLECFPPADPRTVREVSALAVLDADQGYGNQTLSLMKPSGEVDGRDVVELEGCEEWHEGVCRQLFAVPSEGVLFAVTIADDADGSYQAIRDSLRILPEGSTTIPLRTRNGETPTWGAEPKVTEALVDQLKEAGLTVDVTTVERSSTVTGLDYYASFPEGSLLDVSPMLGSVIDVGGTVTIAVSGRSLE